MQKGSKGQLFEDTVDFICRKEHIRNPKAKPYKLRIYTAWAGEPIKYNPELLEDLEPFQVLQIALHEVGHKVRNEGDRTNREYLAEKFAIRMIKKYWPKHYKKALRYTKEIANEGKRWYTEAFNRVLEEEYERKSIDNKDSRNTIATRST